MKKIVLTGCRHCSNNKIHRYIFVYREAVPCLLKNGRLLFSVHNTDDYISISIGSQATAIRGRNAQSVDLWRFGKWANHGNFSCSSIQAEQAIVIAWDQRVHDLSIFSRILIRCRYRHNWSRWNHTLSQTDVVLEWIESEREWIHTIMRLQCIGIPKKIQLSWATRNDDEIFFLLVQGTLVNK